MADFEIWAKDMAGRLGEIDVNGTLVETPTIMPVVNPRIKLIEPHELQDFGAQIIITNSYIIYRTPELRERALDEGLHGLLGTDCPVMTDSGAYQLSVYGDIEVSNTQILEFQREIGSDIAVPLDIPTPPDVSRDRAEEELEITLNRLVEAKAFQDDLLLAGPVQGSTYLDLREAMARKLGEIGFDIYPIGAVVPFMESYRYADLVDIVVASKRGLPPNAPVHLFGAGHPMMFAMAVALGCDLFDSAAYALYARDQRYLTEEGTYHLRDLREFPCSCPICVRHTPEEVLHSHDREELLARHNLYVTFEEMRRVRQAIRDGRLWELVERRSRAHPRLLDGLKRAVKHVEYLERYDPISKATFFYSGPESSNRPEVYRHSKRLDRIILEGRVLVTTGPRPSGFDHTLLLKAPFGPYPVELSETYPIGQSEVPLEPDYEAITTALENLLHLIDLNPEVEFTVITDWEHPLIAEVGRRAEVKR